MNARTGTFTLAFLAFLAATASAQMANPATPTLEGTAPRNAPTEPQTDVVAGAGQPENPVENLTPGSQINPQTPTPGNNLDAEAAAGLADARLAASANAPLLDLTDAIATALRDNPDRKAAFAAVAAARARIGTARSQGGFQASVTGTATGTRYFGQQGSTSSSTGTGIGTGTGTTIGRSVDRSIHSESINISGQQPIYTGGRVSAATRVAEFNVQAQEAQRRQVEQDLIVNTTTAYLTVLRTQQLLDVTESNLAVSRERLRVARVRYDAGASARLDVLRAETDLSNARQLRIQAANNLGQSTANLNTLLGRSPGTPLRLQNITSLSLPADLPLYVTPAAASGGGLTTGAQNAGAPGITAPAQTSPGTPGGDTTNTTGTTSTAGPGTTTAQPGAVGIGATQPGAVGTGTPGGTGITGDTTGDTTGGTNTGPLVPSPAPNTPTIGGTTTVPGGTGAGTTSPGATTTTGTVGITPGATTTTPGVTTQTPGEVTTGTGTTGITTPATGGLTTPTSSTTGAVSTSATPVSASPGNISETAGAQLAAGAGTTRQSLAVTQAQINAAEESVKLAQAQRRPSVSLNPLLLITNPASFLGRFAASLGLSAAQSLFTSGRIASQVAEAKATLEQLHQNYAGQVLDVENGIESSLLSLDSAQRRLTSADVAVSSAREAVRAAQLGFEAGARTALDVSDAQAALLSSQTDAVNARYDVATAQANLAATIGVLPGEADLAYSTVTTEDAARAAAEAGQTGAEAPQRRRRHRILGIF